MNDNKLDIITSGVYQGNAYVIETIDGLFHNLWVAPRFKDGSIDDSQWSEVEDELVIETVTSWNDVEVLETITVDDLLHRINFNSRG